MHGSLETGSPARARSGRFRAGLLLALFASCLVVFVSAAPAAQGVAPPPVIGPGDEGGGSSSGCVEHWNDWHDDAITGTIGIHGPTVWCWANSRVTYVAWNQSPFTNGFWSVQYFGGPWEVGAWCAGGAAADFQGNFQLNYPVIGGSHNGYMRIRLVVCPGGVGSIDPV